MPRADNPRAVAMTLGRFIDELARAHGERQALISKSDVTSFADLKTASDMIAKGLAAISVGKGTRVGLLMPNRCDWLACAVAAYKLGALLVPLNTLLRAPELEYALRFADVAVLIAVGQFLRHDYLEILRDLCPEVDSAAKPLMSPRLPALRHLIVAEERIPRAARSFASLVDGGKGLSDAWLAAAMEAVSPDDPATVFFTSGSTASPKGVVHTHAGMLAAAQNVADRLGLDDNDRTWGYLPFFFTGGLVAVALATLSRGGAVLLQEVFEPGATIDLLSQHGGTTFFAWPHQAEALVSHPDFATKPLQLRKGPGAQAAWAAKVFAAPHQAVGTWGMTETGPMAASTRFDDPLEDRTGAHGRPMPGLEFRIVEPESGHVLDAGQEGELCVRGSSLMAHYYKMSPSECFDANGFFHTGDLASIDSKGLLHFVGRIKDVIKTAGVNVAAADVEAVLLQHPAVTVAHVVGVAHATRGENVAAFVVCNDAACSDEDLMDFCRQRLAAYKVPRHVFVCAESELPALGSGKVDKRALRQRAAKSLAAREEASAPSPKHGPAKPS
ncbi:MAG: AMP-binding protein [Deltaproteobacteria bacterium]|nr:AMP-binding protein [Deltaproteobacteria bacterium]